MLKEFPLFLKRSRFFSFERNEPVNAIYEKTAEQLDPRRDASDRARPRACLDIGNVDNAGGNGTHWDKGESYFDGNGDVYTYTHADAVLQRQLEPNW